MRTLKIILVALAFTGLLGVATYVSADPKKSSDAVKASSALSEVEITIEEIIKINEKLPGEDKQKERRAKLREVIEPRFDFKEMAKRSLGPQWNQCTEQERSEFTDVFSELLARTYLSRIEYARANMVKFDGQNVKEDKAVVKTMVTHKGDTFPIDYKLLQREGQWKVYDVVVENIGLVANYRNEFAGIIRKEKFAGLMERLREKTSIDRTETAAKS